MRGKLAKAIRKVTRFHPADERQYRLTNVVRKFTIKTGGFINLPGYVDVGSLVAGGSRRDYQELKQRVLARKRGGHAHA